MSEFSIAWNLLSGLVGAVLAQVISFVHSERKIKTEYKALLNSIVAECDYNISTIDEILNGAVNLGSFKRLSVENFRTARSQAARYSMKPELVRNLTRLCIDIDLFNLEADYIFSGQKPKDVFAGVIGKDAICVERKPVGRDIEETIRAAREGVVSTLNDVRKQALAEL